MAKKYDEFLNEKNMLVVVQGDDISHAVNFRLTHQAGSATWLAMASTSKDLDKLIASGASHTAIGKDIEDQINLGLKRFRQNFVVEQDHGWQGAGYAFHINFEDILKKLNKS
tara:strand:- start:290 stop:625 length:336 start_codon:yes stop_codon:yes gene_type:complete